MELASFWGFLPVGMWDVARSRWVFGCRCFETMYWSCLHPQEIFLDTANLEDENIPLYRNVGNQISCDASSLLGQFDL